MQGAQVHSLVRELRSHMPCGMAKKNKKKKKLKEKMLDLRLMQNQMQSYMASVDCYSDA